MDGMVDYGQEETCANPWPQAVMAGRKDQERIRAGPRQDFSG